MPRVGTTLVFSDRIGAWKARWGINRMNYLIPPGLYAVGDPTPDAPVLVTANYKMSYDLVRRELQGRDVWLLILETFGINVWCAAGKGSFGTDELVERIEKTALAKVVNHRRLVLPILGAPGVAAPQVTKRTGFHIVYATLRSCDLPEFLDNGMVTTPAMRELRFSLYDRLVLIPVEVVLGLKPIVATGLLVALAAFLWGGSRAAVTALMGYFGAFLAGTVATPLLLPWIPGRSFAVKGALTGLVFTICFYLGAGGGAWSLPVALAAFLTLPAVSAFFALNFTGCTTFTSRSGVKKEMRLSIPVMGGALLASLLLLVVGKLV